MKTMMKKLLNPFALVVEGFAAGALLFFATMAPEQEIAQAPTQPAALEAIA